MRFAQLTLPARAYIVGTYVLASGLIVALAPLSAAAADALTADTLAAWPTFLPLLLLATVAHSFPVHTPNRQSYYVSLPFFTTAILLLHPAQVAAVLVLPNLVEWRFRGRSWIAQLFNVAAYLISGLAAQATYGRMSPVPFGATALVDTHAVVAAGFAILVFLTVNRALVSGAIGLANRLPPFGMAELESVAGEAILLGMGVPLAALAAVAPWALLPAAAPLLLVHRAFEMPNMRAQRRHDELTDLFTRPYLLEVAERELSRAQRFGRPVTLLVMRVVGLEAITAEHGRQAEDIVLRRIADLLRATTREYDVAARVGERSFGLLLPECDVPRASSIAERLQVLVAQEPIEIPSSLEPQTVRLIVGLASRAEGGQALFEAASDALAQSATTRDGMFIAEIDPAVTARASATDQPPSAEPVTESARVEDSGDDPDSRAGATTGRRWSIALQIAVFMLAAAVAVPLVPSFGALDGWAGLWMITFVALAEILGIELFGGSSYSISTVPIIAAGLLLGPTGAATVAAIGLVLRGIQLRTRWYKVAFNVNTHVIAAAAATSVFEALAPELSLEHLPWMICAAALAGATFYLHTLLVAMAMATELRVNPVRIWVEHFRWLWIQYLVLGALGLLLALAYHLFGLLGGLIFIVPAVMMRYVAKQYLDKTMDHVRQLRSLNEHLAREVSQRKQSEASLEYHALHDVLTGLPNRLLLQDRAQQSLLAAHRDGHSMALLLLDLDRFKEINDTLGHHAGDDLLKQTATRLLQALRESDTIARLGGDEFAAVLAVADTETASQTAERLVHVLERPFDLEGRQVEIHASIGIAVSEGDGDTPADLLRQADVAMYSAKRAGGNGYRLYVADQDDNTPERLALTADLRLAMANRELALHYQPKVDLRSGRITSVEALVRWHHPQRGLLSPAVFIPLAESSGLIEQLSHYVLDEALRQCRQWRDAGVVLEVAVNLSMRDLQNPELPNTIAHLLGSHGLVPESLTVEITEGTLMADPPRALEVTRALSSMGVRLAIDDFGTGYSSLAYLKQLSVHELKVDQSFVRHLTSSNEDAAIVRSTIGLAHELGLSVVAEGVEDQRAGELLIAYGCDMAQGYHISRPVPAHAIAELVRSYPQTRSGMWVAA